MSSQPPQLPQQAGVRSALRRGGPIVFGIGLLLTIVAMVDFFGAAGTFRMPTMFWMGFIGLPMMAIGFAMMKAGYLGPAVRYVAGEVTPTIKDTLAYAGFVAGAQTCPTCGGTSPADATFCDDCGAPLSLACASCGHRNDPAAQFCASCGKPLTSA